jgi:hypothetical protein
MRFHVFLSGFTILFLGIMAMNLLDKTVALGFLNGALTLGGGIIICGLFSLKAHWHGLIGAGVLALLGTGRGLANIPDLAGFLSGARPRGNAPLLEAAVTLVCLVLLVRVLRALQRERLRRMLEQE